MEVALVDGAVFKGELSFAFEPVVAEVSNVGELFALQLASDSDAIFVVSIEAKILAPFLALAVHHPGCELSAVALFFGDEGALPVGKVIFEEAVVVEVIGVKFSVALAEQVDYLPAVEGAIGHG